jgi:hypothetical protein
MIEHRELPAPEPQSWKEELAGEIEDILTF